MLVLHRQHHGHRLPSAASAPLLNPTCALSSSSLPSSSLPFMSL
jgi:hypothetical protein